MPGFLNLDKAREQMLRHNLQGLLICSPENILYATGYTPMLLDLYRQAPLALCYIPANEQAAPVAFVPETDVNAVRAATHWEHVQGFPVWWELYHFDGQEDDLTRFQQYLSPTHRDLPGQYEITKIAAQVGKFLAKEDYPISRVGIEQEFISQQVHAAFEQALPAVTWIDSTPLLYGLRSIKTEQEIDYLAKACRLTETGIQHSANAIQPGATIGDLTYVFQKAVLEDARELGLLNLLGEMGGQPAFGPAGRNHPMSIQAGLGTTVKYDMQVSIAHYHSDMGRTYLSGQPTALQSFVYKTLLDTHQQLIDAVRPGLRICDLHQVGRAALDKAGLNRISRGHFGHSVGLDNKIEEPPFISMTETAPIQPGMVLAVETPCYIDGVGKYQIEDMLVVTEDGARNLNHLSKAFNERAIISKE